MAENFDGEPKPIETPQKPEQQTLRDRVDVWEDTNSGVELDKLLAAQQGDEGDPKPAEGDGDKPKEGEGDGKPAEGEGEGDDGLNLPDPDTVKVPDDAGDPLTADDIKPTKEGEGEGADDDPYKDIQLPPNVRGKSAEKWAELKTRFKTDLEKRDEEIAALKAQVSERDAKLTNTPEVPKETAEELESLRQFKAKLDIEADPNFHKEFDGKIAQAKDFIFTQLEASENFGKDAVAKIKELGVENVDWDGLADKMGPQTARLVQSRLDTIAIAQHDKKLKLEEVKKDVQTYINKQRESYAERGTKHLEDTEAQLTEFKAKMPFLHDPEPLKATATKEERAVFEANEAHRKNIIDALDEAKKDDSPYMRAVLIAGMGQLLNIKPRFEQLAEYSKAQDAKLEKALAWIEKVKNAGKPKNKETTPETTPPKPGVDYTQDAGSALDAYRKANPNA
jgi:hypothetical protein